MKKLMLFVLLICVGLSAYAINYPTYKSTSNRHTQSQSVAAQEVQPIGGYSIIATGGTTTTGEGSAIGGYGPRRALWDGVSTPNVGDSNGNGQVWNGTEWVSEDEDTDENAGDPLPVGNPVLPMLCFALLAAGALYLRRQALQV